MGTDYTTMISMLQPQAATGSAGDDTDTDDTKYYVRVRHSKLRKEAQTETIYSD